MPGLAVCLTVENCAGSCASYHGCHIYLSPASVSLWIATSLFQSNVILFLASISSSFFVLPVCSFWNCKCNCSRLSLWTVLRVGYDIVCPVTLRKWLIFS